MGGAVGLSLGREESAHLQTGCGTAFPCLGCIEELTRLATHWLHSGGVEQKQTGIFGSKNWSDQDREGTANNPRASLQSVRAAFESLPGKGTAGGQRCKGWAVGRGGMGSSLELRSDCG